MASSEPTPGTALKTWLPHPAAWEGCYGGGGKAGSPKSSRALCSPSLCGPLTSTAPPPAAPPPLVPSTEGSSSLDWRRLGSAEFLPSLPGSRLLQAVCSLCKTAEFIAQVIDQGAPASLHLAGSPNSLLAFPRLSLGTPSVVSENRKPKREGRVLVPVLPVKSQMNLSFPTRLTEDLTIPLTGC